MAQFGNGIVAEYDVAATLATATPTFVTLGELYDVGGPSLSADALDASVHGDAWRKFIGGLRDAGEVSLSCRAEADNLTQQNLRDNMGKTFLWRLSFPLTAGATTPLRVEVDAVLTGFEMTGPHDDLLDLTVTLKASGEPEWSAEV